MDLSIAAILAQDGITNGAVYALLALALVLVFSVTRVILIPQGEFVAFGALTLAAIQSGHYPLTANLLVALGGLVFAKEALGAMKVANQRRQRLLAACARFLVLPLAIAALASTIASPKLPLVLQVLLTLLIVAPMGPMIYRLAFEPLAGATTLVLLIVSVGVHFAMLGMGLIMFGAEGSRTTPFSDASINVGGLAISGQSVVVVAVSLVLIAALYAYFERTLSGKALRATAINRLGAQLVGIGTVAAGRMAFTLAAAMGALCGMLIAPLTTVYYDSGFLIGLKGFVGAIMGGLAAYPAAAAGALLVGSLESVSSFWASSLKEVIVFTLIIPVLLWRSLGSHHIDEGDE